MDSSISSSSSSEFICPLSNQRFVDPVILGTSGVTFERSALETYLAEQPDPPLHPITSEPLVTEGDRIIIPNHALKKLLQREQQQYNNLLDDDDSYVQQITPPKYTKKKQTSMNHKRGGCLILWSITMLRIMTIYQIINSSFMVSTANGPSNRISGYRSTSFAAIWSMIFTIIFTGPCLSTIKQGYVSDMTMGFTIGFTFMISELFFVFMIIFFTEAGIANNTGNKDLAEANNSYGSFCMFQMIVYFISGILFTCYRKSIMASQCDSQEIEYDPGI